MKHVIVLPVFALMALAAINAHAQDRPALGIAIVDDPVGGAQITSVFLNSPAAQAGLKLGDRIVTIDQQPVTNYQDVLRIIAASAPNSQVNLDVMRGTTRTSVSATLGRAQQVLPTPVVSPVVPVYRPAPMPRYYGWPTRPNAPLQAPPFF